MSDLINRLRCMATAPNNLSAQAADALEAKNKEIAELNQMVENIGNLHSTTIDEWAKMKDLCDQLGEAIEEMERNPGGGYEDKLATEALTAWRAMK